MTLRIHVKVFLHVRSYEFYEITLSTEEERRNMINMFYVITNYKFVTGDSCTIDCF